MFQSKKESYRKDQTIKEWFVIFDKKQEGPYSLLDLKKDPRFTPDHLVWRKGFHEWTPARFVIELQEIFKDEPESKTIHDNSSKKSESVLGQQEQVTLTLQQDPYQMFLWILLILLIILYSFYFFYNS